MIPALPSRLRANFVVIVLGIFWPCLGGCKDSSATPVPAAAPPSNLVTSISSPDDEALMRKLCTQCHLFADPDVLPKSEWNSAITSMVSLPGYGRTIPKRISPKAIEDWFRKRAPETLSLADRASLPIEPPPRQMTSLKSPRSKGSPFVSQCQLVTWPETGERKLLACDMRNGWLMEAKLNKEPLELRVFCDQVPHPARMQIVDLDADGRSEFVVANLGSFPAMDHNLGTVDWLRPTESGWERIILAENLGRVADVKAFDFDGDGDLDLAVAEFGWRLTGHVVLLENTTPKSGRARVPKFEKRILDERHGAEQVEITDIDGNGLLDMIVLLAQEHELLVAYLNLGAEGFKARELFRAPHPVWGYSGFQLLDFDGDQDLDVLLTNGDMMDGPAIKPYHSVTWLENLGDMKFESHVLAELPGCHRAEAVDLDGDGDFDIVACTLVPAGTDQQAVKQGGTTPPSLIWLEQTAPREFQLHVWERGPGRYPTLVTGDADGDGRPDVAVGVGLWETLDRHEGSVEYLKLWRSNAK